MGHDCSQLHAHRDPRYEKSLNLNIWSLPSIPGDFKHAKVNGRYECLQQGLHACAQEQDGKHTSDEGADETDEGIHAGVLKQAWPLGGR